MYSQLDDTATTTNATLVFFKIPAGTSVPEGIKYIDLMASSNGNSHAFRGTILCRRFSDYTGTCPEMNDFTVTTDATSTTKSATLYHLPFTTVQNVSLSASRYYAFGIQRTSGDAAGIELRGTTTPKTCVITGCGGPGGTPYVVLSDGIEEAETINPVIIIPGILGSEQVNGEWVIDPILHTYDDLIATLDVNYYTPDVDLFTFPYNWRKSNVETAVLLKQKIDAVKEICQCDKVDLAAHSMGGLVARQYIQSNAYEQDVDQLIFLGTPHLGAPKAYLMWEGGEADPVGVANFVLQRILDQEAKEKGYSDLFTYIQSEPIDSLRELLPTYDYIFDNNLLRKYPTNYPTNPFLQTLNNGVSSLLNSGVELHNFVGNMTNSGTITAVNVVNTSEFLPLWPHGYPSGFYEELGNFGLERGSGDATVPLPSTSFVQANITLSGFEHNKLPDELKASIFAVLTGDAPNIVIDNDNGTNFKLLLIKMLSPADLLVVAPDGRKIGKENGQVVNQILGAFYTGFNTDTEFITIPNPIDGEYTIVTQGTGSGAYTVEASYISEQKTFETSFTGNTMPDLVTELTVPVNNQNPEELEIESVDTEAPAITITQPEAKDHLRSEQMPISISAEDVSGVFVLESFFGTTTIPNTGIVDLFFKKLGTHKITASSTDNVGNATTSMRTFRVVANTTSTLSDVERSYKLGWTTQKVRDDLIKKMKACNVQKKIISTVTKTVVVAGRDEKPTTKKVQEKIEKIEIVFDKNCAKGILKDIEKYRGKGLNDQAYQILKEDIQWLLNN